MVKPSHSRQPSWLAITMPALCLFFALGLNIGSWASRLADLKIAMSITDMGLGFFLLATSLGAISAFPLTIWLLRHVGARKMALLLGSIAACLLPLIMNNTSYHLGLVLMFIEGICCAGLNAAINTYGSDIERKHDIKCMSRLHAVFSLGLAAAALISMGLIRFVSSELIVHGAVICVSLLMLFAVAYRTSEQCRTSDSDDKQPEPKLINKTTLVLGIIVLSATIIEGSMNDWSAIYLKDVIDVSPSLAPSGVLVFSAAMFIGRLFADSLRSQYNDAILIALAGLIVSFSLATGVWLSGLYASWISFAIVGLTVSLVSPIIYASAAAIGPGCLSLISTFGSIGGLAGPPTIGFIATHFGLTSGMYFVAASGLVIGIAALKLAKHQHTPQYASL
ncbi:MFS transporter [Vibrio coralliilyticus]|uniref:MFS transporter n=1 Tax=Vibrio coralliilyticus TaxID=190893 RepID=UPI000C1636F1|nr:MFS transporter [Vibrio coralliilyticus]